MLKKPKSINALMSYLRTHHGIAIKGSLHKRKLQNIGYYHGFKGYRYNRVPNNIIPYTDFNQILAINKFDMSLKAMFYPEIMFVETALKNHALAIVLKAGKTYNFNDIFNNLLVGYQKYPVQSGKYINAMQRRLEFRTKLYGTLTSAYKNKKKVITHFYHKNDNVPIWAIFETINLGEFGTFIYCLKHSLKVELSKTLRLNQSCDTNAELTQSMIYIVKDLRNAIAHNEIIFDTRFKNTDIGPNVIRCLEIDVGVSSIKFENIVDYLILIAYLLKNLKVSKKEILKMISLFEEATETLRKEIPINMYMSILPTDTKKKLTLLRAFVKKQK